MHDIVRAQKLGIHVVQVAPGRLGGEELALNISVLVPGSVLLQLTRRGLADAKPIVFERFFVVPDIRKPILLLPLRNAVRFREDTNGTPASWIVQLCEPMSILIPKASCRTVLVMFFYHV